MIDFSLLDTSWETSKKDLLKVVDSKGEIVAFTETCIEYARDRRHAQLIALLPRVLRAFNDSALCLNEHEYFCDQIEVNGSLLDEIKEILGEVDYWANHPSTN